MKFLVQKIDNKLTLDFCHEIMVSQIYSKWRGEPYQIKYAEKEVPKGLKHPENYIPIGTVEFVRDYINIYFPNKSNCLIPLNVPDALKTFAGRYVWDIDCEEAIPDILKANDDDTIELFRKSLYKIKDESNGFIEYKRADANKLIGYQVSTKINDIRSEWRVFVHHNDVKQVCYYDDDPACDAAYEFADYVWNTYIHQIDYDKIALYGFNAESAKTSEICTKDLRKAKILCINKDDIIVSIKDFNAEEVILRYKKDGNPCNEKYDSDEYGLCILRHRCTGYINLFDVAESGNIITSNVFATEEEAKADIKKPEYYLDTIKIEFCR